MTDTQQAKSDREALLARLEQAEARVKELEAELSLIYASEGAASGPSGPSFTGTVAAGTPEPLSTGFERAEIHGEPVAAKRVETGPVRIGDDWAGLFLRGDNALFMVHAVARAADALRATDPLTAVMVDGLVTDMRSCQEPCEARPLYAHPDPAVERLQRELDEARKGFGAILGEVARLGLGAHDDADGVFRLNNVPLITAETNLAKAREALKDRIALLRSKHQGGGNGEAE